MRDGLPTSRPLIRGLPELKSQGRDLRIDACRGIALWWLFLNHIPDNIGSWLTPRNYGFSDAAEIFVFVSGVTCALAYGGALCREGWSGVVRRTVRRSWDIYVAFLLLTLGCTILAYVAGGDRLADASNTRVLLDHPGGTLARAAILQYRPVNTDVLPIFVLLHLLFAPLLWLLLRKPNVTLGASLVLYTLVHAFDWTVPAWPNSHWAFNPLAWQLLVVLGAWWMIEGEKARPWVTSRPVLVIAVLYILFSLIVTLSWRIKPLEALIPQALALHTLDKSNLDPLRLLHFLAIAVLAAWCVPRDWRGLTTPVMRAAIRCGQNSLPVYCVGVLLAFASHAALLEISNGLAMQIALSLGGVVTMIATATLARLISVRPRRGDEAAHRHAAHLRWIASGLAKAAADNRSVPKDGETLPEPVVVAVDRQLLGVDVRSLAGQ
ncbi:OpgC domain-containing protein [Bradyrhizobium lablabi]|uniref:OpgC domain-containing protein n=1 Tax=Bradyrhizobium lablabi TaxID=722472 RepID=UPI001BA6DFBE|nr:OpgC domain-containing protein [Bradyrhizobium lablabi]MBR0697697.1 OpgC domain-containing protein [Bradyrhizobium lablabi]